MHNWTIIAEDIYLADIGTPGYTEYEVNKRAFTAPDVVKIYEKFPDLLEGKLKMQHIHSHHGMSTFFSSTDWENLEDRAAISNYFLMLIVNFDGKYCAKVAFKAKKEGERGGQLSFVNNVDEIPPILMADGRDKEVLAVMDCKVVFEVSEVAVDPEFEDRLVQVTEAIKEAKKREEEEKAKKKVVHVPATRKQGEIGFPTGVDEGAAFYAKFKWQKDRWVPRNNPWNRGDFHMLVNAIIDGSLKPKNFKGTIARLEEVSDKLKTVDEFEEFCASFEAKLREFFDQLYPGKDDEDFVYLLSLGMDIIEPYTDNNKLTEEIFEIIWEEAEIADKWWKDIYENDKQPENMSIID